MEKFKFWVETNNDVEYFIYHLMFSPYWRLGTY